MFAHADQLYEAVPQGEKRQPQVCMSLHPLASFGGIFDKSRSPPLSSLRGGPAIIVINFVITAHSAFRIVGCCCCCARGSSAGLTKSLVGKAINNTRKEKEKRLRSSSCVQWRQMGLAALPITAS